MNPAKLKVVELRAELSARGLDTKGNKAVLVERLQEALDQEEGNEGGDKSRQEEGDRSEDQNEAKARTDTSEQEHGSESETDPVQKPVAVEPPREPSPEPEVAKEQPADDEPAPEHTDSTPKEEQEPSKKSPSKEKTPQESETPQTSETPKKVEKPSVEQAEMEVDEKKPYDDEKEGKEHPSDEKMEATEESEMKKEPEDSEYDKHQNEENGVKEGYEQDVKSEIKNEDDIKTETDAVKSETPESKESRKRRRSSSPSPRARGQVKSYDREPDLKDNEITLSWYDSDLNLTIDDKTFMSATPMSDGGFGYVWAGVRGSHGFKSGSLCYQVKVTNFLDVSHLEDEPNPNVLRVGWSSFCTSLQLGEEPFSYGYGGTGKFSVDCKFTTYGKSYSLNDVITCYLEFTDDEAVMSFGLNDEYLGVAHRVPLDSLEGKALAPHILTKNAAFAVNFGQEDTPWTRVEENYVFLNKYPIEDAVPGPRRPEKKSDCEMIMMCGLPGCGKTVWANKYAAEHPEKNYNILGTNFLIDKMKVMGLPRKANYHGRWDVLIEKCTKCLQRLMDIGSHRRRNYILDQTNVYPAAQRRKMRNFEGFTRKAVVIVPTDEEFKSRVEKQAKEEKKDVPESAVLEMKANFTLPDKGLFDEVNYIELQEEEAQALIQKYAKEAADKGVFPKSGPSGPPSKRFRGGDYHHPKNDYRRDRFSSGPPSGPFRRGADRGGPRGGGWGSRGGPMDRWRDNRNQGGYGRPPQGDRQGWRGPPSGPPGGNGRGPRDYDRGPPRGGYDRNSRSGPPQRPGSSYNNRDHPRDQRGPPGGPKPGMGGKPRPGEMGKHSAGGGPQSAAPAQWNSQYQNQGQQPAAANQAWGQQAQWNNANAQAWNNYQNQWKGYQQGYNQQGYGQGYNAQQYNNWQQYFGQYNAQGGGGWGQNSDGTYNYPQNWPSWYAAQNAGQTNTTQPPPAAK